MSKFWFLLSLLISLFGCASFREEIAPKDKENIKKIAILSDLGPNMNFHYAGSIALRDKEQKINVASWDIDKSFENILLTELEKSKKYALVEVVSKNITQRPYLDQMVTFKKNGVKINHYLQDIERLGFDTLIVIQAWKQIEDDNLVPGYGIFYNNRILIHEQSFYLTAKIRVYNTHTKKEIISKDLLTNPLIALEEYPKRKRWEEWPSSEIEQVKAKVLPLVQEGLTQSLAHFGLN